MKYGYVVVEGNYDPYPVGVYSSLAAAKKGRDHPRDKWYDWLQEHRGHTLQDDGWWAENSGDKWFKIGEGETPTTNIYRFELNK